MLKSEQIRRKESIRDIVRDYRYNRNIPQRDLLIDNRPAIIPLHDFRGIKVSLTS